MTRLAILIVSHNAAAALARCLDSLVGAPPSTPHEVVVVDNASSDGSPAAVRRRFPGVRLIEAGGNLGFAAANNLGIRATQGDLVLLLNGDTLVPPGAVDRLVEALDARPEVAAAGPRLVDAEGRAELSFGAAPGLLREAWQKLLVRGHARRMPVISSCVERATRRERRPHWISGACLLVRRADLEAVGGLDERYFLYKEDVDLCTMLRRRGRDVLFTPAVEITHLRGQSGASNPDLASESYRRSQLAYYAKHRPAWLPVLRWYLRLSRKLPRPS